MVGAGEVASITARQRFEKMRGPKFGQRSTSNGQS